MGFPGGSAAKNLPATEKQEDRGSPPGSGRSPEGGNGNSLQYSCWDSSMDRGVWQATVHRIAESQNDWSSWAHTNTHAHTHRRMKWANIHGAWPMGGVLSTFIIFHPAFQLSISLFTLFWDLGAPTQFLGQSTLKSSMNGWRQESGTMGNMHILALYYISSIQNCVWHIVGAQCIPFESINR